MPQLVGSFNGQVGGVLMVLADAVVVLPVEPETVLAPNPLRANARTNPRINKASMGESPLNCV